MRTSLITLKFGTQSTIGLPLHVLGVLGLRKERIPTIKREATLLRRGLPPRTRSYESRTSKMRTAATMPLRASYGPVLVPKEFTCGREFIKPNDPNLLQCKPGCGASVFSS
jgi:hypothetical protein